MKKLSFFVLTAMAFLPVFALALYNDVTLTTSTIINVGGVNLSVSGGSAEVESIVVSADSFSVTLLPSSSITVVSGDRRTLSANVSNSDYVKNICSESSASLILTADPAVSSVTITVTPSASACSTAASAGGGSGGGGGGGGGIITSTVTTASPTVVATSVVTTTPAAQTTSVSVGSATSFNSDLKLGVVNSDVRALQQFLNTNGFAVAQSGVGSLGSETNYFGLATRAALIRYQVARNITPAVGYLGPKTRVSINSEAGKSPTQPAASTISGCSPGDTYSTTTGQMCTTTTTTAAAVSVSVTPTQAPPGSFARNLDVGMKGEDVRALQQYLNVNGFVITETGAGSPGNETNYFGLATRAALASFQESKGITPAVGYFGPKTRALVGQ